MVISSKAVTPESLAVSRNVYVPATRKVAAVLKARASSKLTGPGPAILLQVHVMVAGGSGSPSSLTVPESPAVAGGTVA